MASNQPGIEGRRRARKRVSGTVRALSEAVPAHNVSHSLHLTLEEALGLLDMALLVPCELTHPQQTAVEKVGAFCRQLTTNSSEAVTCRIKEC